MKNNFFIIIILLVTTLFCECTNTKNTVATRSFHNVTSHYNVLFNAGESYKKGIEKSDNNPNLDYTSILPVYKIDAKNVGNLVASDMETCTEKCAKNILKHSITKKPKKKYGFRGMSESEKEFYEKPDYCKWIDETYLMMGKANYAMGDLDRAESSLYLVTTRFRKEPTKFEALVWLSKTYLKQNREKDALETLSRLEQDLRHDKKLDKDIHKVYAQNYIDHNNYTLACQELEKALSLEKNKKEQSYLSYLLADVYRISGKPQLAKEYYQKVIKQNKDYSLVFNSKINLATVINPNQDSQKTIKELNKMLQEEKNSDFKDRIYFALGEISKRKQDTLNAIKYYQKSANSSTKNTNQKAKSYLSAAELCFLIPDYLKSAAFYDSTLMNMPKESNEYKQIANKSEALSKLAKCIQTANYNDSLLTLGKMSEGQRNKIIEQKINEVIAYEQSVKNQALGSGYSDNNYGVKVLGQDGNPGFQGKWYMYNQQALKFGSQEFTRKWGKRPLEDNWRRSNKNISTFVDQDENLENNDNQNNTVLDNKSKEYYLQNIPLTLEDQQKCKETIVENIFVSSNIYKEDLNDIDKAIDQLLLITEKYPNTFIESQVYYKLYELYIQKHNNDRAGYYKSLLEEKYPSSGYSRILNDPEYLNNIQKHKQDGLNAYNQCLEEYQNQNYLSAINLCKSLKKDYLDLEIVENFDYLHAICQGKIKKFSAMKEELNNFVNNYPKSTLINNIKLKLEVLNSGEYDIEKFIVDDSPLEVWIISKTDKTLKFKALDQSNQNNQNHLEITSKEIFDYFRVTVDKFKSKEEAIEFYKKFYINQKGDYEIFYISNSNANIIKQENDIKSYINWFRE